MTVAPVALNGPNKPGVDGIDTATPLGGMARGIGVSKLRVPVAIDAGVAPATSMVDEAVPVSDLVPRAAAAPTMLAGIVTWVW